jgi:hypothetical protein
MKKIVIAFIAFFTALTSLTYAQSEYKSAIGGRVGVPIAGSIKHFIFETGAIEGYAGFRSAGLSQYAGINITLGVMYQHHFPIGDIDGFQWYVGGGALVQFYNYDDDYNFTGDKYSSTGLAINGVGGVDYKFKNIPLNVSADWMPTFFLNKTYYNNFGAGYGGIAARYTFR